MRVRTGYSFRTAVGHVPELISRIKEIGWTVAPISDRLSTFGFNRWTKAARKAGLRPAYGFELAVVPTMGEKKPTTDYWTFFAMDSLRPLHELFGKATLKPGKEPSLLYKEVLAAQGVIKIAGERCRFDELGEGISDPNLYFGLTPSVSKGAWRAAKAAGMRPLAMSDNYFPRVEDKEFYRVALGRRAFTQTYAMHLLSDSEWREAMEFIATKDEMDAALSHRDAALAQCSAELRSGTLFQPEREATLQELCERGAARVGCDLSDPVYAARLGRELALIEEKGFADYFYIIADIVSWAKERMVVGPARGSSCGSLVCYLLDITTVDPIPYGLIFERFIDINRADMPDIDIDFSDKRRHLVFDYAEERFGRDHVARLGTVGMFKPRSALQQTGMALRIPGWRVEKVLDGLIERSSADARSGMALADTLMETEEGRKLMADFPEAVIAGRMENHPSNASQHAAGIVVTKEPLIEYVAVDHRAKAVHCDKVDAEELNLLKIDALGLTQLSIFERVLELIGKPARSGFLETIDLNDPLAFEVLNKKHFSGIFQFTGQTLQGLAKQVTINKLEDIVSITALARPGPMTTGGAASWAKRREGKEKVETLHPMMTEITKDTFGVTVYQEQVMNIVRIIGKMSWEDVSAVRKGMSKRMGSDYFARYYARFLEGALENGLKEETAAAIWKQINTFGAWAFNRSHAVAYGIVSYYCCWLKAHYPVEFAAATLDAEDDPMKQIVMLRELEAEGVGYVPVDPEHSTDRWEPVEKDGKKFLVGPLTNVKGIGPATVIEIMKSRERGEPIRPSILKKLASARTAVDSMFPVRDRVRNAVDLEALKIFTQPTPVVKCEPGVVGEVMIIAIVTKINPKDENEEANVIKRGGRVYSGPHLSLGMFAKDDTDEIYCKINRYKYEQLALPVIQRGRAQKAVYAIKGRIPAGFRMIDVTQMRYICDMDENYEEPKQAASEDTGARDKALVE